MRQHWDLKVSQFFPSVNLALSHMEIHGERSSLVINCLNWRWLVAFQLGETFATYLNLYL